jgi:hypothetical protein
MAMDTTELELRFTNASQELDTFRMKLFEKSEIVIGATEKLEGAKMEALSSGRIDGKNETERKGQLAELTHAETEALTVAQKDERRARLEFDLALSAFDLMRYRLRIAEIASAK